MPRVAYLNEIKGSRIDTGESDVPGWAAIPTINSFDQDTILDCEAFQRLPVLAITKGAIGLRHILGDGRQTISVIHFDGEVLDFRHFGRLSGKLICILPVTANLYKGNEFDQMKRDSTLFQIEHTAIRARQNVYASLHSLDLARKSAVEKLASFIFESRKRQNLGRALNVELRLRRADIADYMGLRIETLSRAFSKLKKMRLIESSDGDEVQIIDEPGLRQLANGRVA
jgi:CRP-like cAMP-binding protein